MSQPQLKAAFNYEQIKRQCEAHARRKGFPQDAEDFASFTILDAIERNDFDIYVERRFVDYLRKHYGRSGSSSGDAKQRERLQSKEFVEGLFGADSPGGRISDEIGDEFTNSSLNRKAYILLKGAGFSVAEIASIYKKSPAAVSNTVRKAKPKVSYLATESLALVVKNHILNVLESCGGNRTHCAQKLGISLRSLRNHLRRYREV